MEVLITRNMTIATDAGTARQFVKGEKPDISLTEFGRLKRAKAAVLGTGGTEDDSGDDHDGKGEIEGANFEEMSKAELLAFAAANEIDVDPKDTKAVILAKIKAEEAND